MDSRIVIVGGGAAGLSAAGALKRRGLDSIVLDRNAQIGDVWTQRYDRLRLHTVYSSIAHYPLPRHYPKYPTKAQYAEYLREYARHFKLNIVAGCAVQCVGPTNDSPPSGWRVTSDCGEWQVPVVITVIAATGYRSGLPQLLDLPDALDEHGYPRFASGQPTSFPGLYFIGYTHSLRGHLYEANLDSRRLAEHVQTYLEES